MPDSLYLIKAAVKSAYKQILFCLQALFFYFPVTLTLVFLQHNASFSQLTGTSFLYLCLRIHRAQSLHQLLADLQLVLAICLDHNVCCASYFSRLLLHQLCDIRHGLVALKQRTVVIILDAV